MEDKWQELQDRIGEWADVKEGGTERTPDATILHLLEEVEHLKEDPYNPFNLGDCFHLLIEVARLTGNTMDDAYIATRAKFEINKTRVWGERDEKGISRHVKED